MACRIIGYSSTGYSWDPSMLFDNVLNKSDWRKAVILGYDYPKNYIHFKTKCDCYMNCMTINSYYWYDRMYIRNINTGSEQTLIPSGSGGKQYVWYKSSFKILKDIEYIIRGVDVSIGQLKFTYE